MGNKFQSNQGLIRKGVVEMEEWKEYGQCKHCDKIFRELKFSSNFFIPVCPKCGEQNFSPKAVTARQVRIKGKWYNPLTWGQWEWEFK